MNSLAAGKLGGQSVADAQNAVLCFRDVARLFLQTLSQSYDSNRNASNNNGGNAESSIDPNIFLRHPLLKQQLTNQSTWTSSQSQNEPLDLSKSSSNRLVSTRPSSDDDEQNDSAIGADEEMPPRSPAPRNIDDSPLASGHSSDKESTPIFNFCNTTAKFVIFFPYEILVKRKKKRHCFLVMAFFVLLFSPTMNKPCFQQ